MSYQAGVTDASAELLNLLGRPSFNAHDELRRSVYEQPLLTHPALIGEPELEASSLPLISLAAVSGDSLAAYPLAAIGTGAYMPQQRQELDTPERPVCTFFLRTGTCAYGDRCKFQHPRDRPPPVLNSR